MEYYPLDTAEYATAFQASDWLYLLMHGINIDIYTIDTSVLSTYFISPSILALEATPLLRRTTRLMSSLRTNTRPPGDVSSSFLVSGMSVLESLTLSGVELLSLLLRLLDKLSESAFSAL